MGYRILGRLHAELHHNAVRALRAERGQGTVEYVALILLVAAVLAAVVAATEDEEVRDLGHRRDDRQADEGDDGV